MGSAAGKRMARALPWALVFAFGASLSLQSIRTFDYWWHLRTGQLIAETSSTAGVFRRRRR